VVIIREQNNFDKKRSAMRFEHRPEYNPEPGHPVGRRWFQAAIVCLLVLGLLTSGVNLLVPRVSSQLRGGWYLRSNQWRADARTAVAILKFVLERGPGLRLSLGKVPNPAVDPLTVDIAQTNVLSAVPTA